MTYRALLIGNSVFDEDAGLNPLNAPTKDVARLHRALVDPATGLFQDDHVRLVIERSSHDLLDELDTFFSAAHRDDLLLLYYSGHGLLDHHNQLFLCGRNTRSDKLLRTAVSNVRINEFIEQSVARCTVIVLDCCSSGMFKGGDVSAPLAGPGRYVVSSTRGAALANDAAIATGTSLFTEHLVTGLLGAATDHNSDGFLDLREVFDYVRTRLTATTKQIPHCRFDGDAAVVLAKRAATPTARAGDPTFVLSENVVDLRDVGADERLSNEVIDIFPLSDAGVDCAAETGATWLGAEVHENRLTIELRPVPGHNRGKIVVRDRRSGTAQVVRVHVAVDRPSAPPVTPAADKTTAALATDAEQPTRFMARAPVPGVVGLAARGTRERRRRKRPLIALVALVVVLISGSIGLLLRPDDDEGPVGTTPQVPWSSSSAGSTTQTSASAAAPAPTRTRRTTRPPTPGPGATTTAPVGCVVSDVTGMAVASARAVLENDGFTIRVLEVSSDVPAGTVVRQSPRRGAKAGCGSGVTLTVASEPPPETTPPPDGTGG